MTLDMGDLDQMTKIAPNGGSRIGKGTRRILEGFGIHLNAMVMPNILVE